MKNLTNYIAYYNNVCVGELICNKEMYPFLVDIFYYEFRGCNIDVYEI
jgi:hypothetical protein